MVSFECDYTMGAHPAILRSLIETNYEPLTGYGMDEYTSRAKDKIRRACGLEEADVEFLVGGTQANSVIISTMLKDYEGVIAASSGHINVHESGAVEFTGHKVLVLPQEEGKIVPQDLRDFLVRFYSDVTHDHMVFPGMVYISHPTEPGTLYSRKELEETQKNALHTLTDAIGVRVVCLFVDDVYECVKRIREFPRVSVVTEKDYILDAKSNGYRSYHMIVDVTSDEEDVDGNVPGHYFAEIQLRTIAMDTWAALEHELKYKKNIVNQEMIIQELHRCANDLAACDVSMQTLRKIIREMQ